uniref:ADP-ribosylation factor-like protein 6-interacting protein 6 n=1 Tax=Diabrotica virgifera virgifera TaxID=50390 RepID=A0A6P7FMX6_DIAVI
MSRPRYNVRFSISPDKVNSKEEQTVWTEWKVAVYGLVISLLIIVVKFFTNYGNQLEKTFIEDKLVYYKVWSEDGQEMFTTTWKHAAKYSNIWLPIVCGVLSSYFTWMMVYLDSNEPGVQPPSPFSPKKYKEQSGHTFHLNYVFAIIIGFLVSGYMFMRGVSIVY